MMYKIKAALIRHRNNKTYRREYKMRMQILLMIIVVNIVIFIAGIIGMRFLPENYGKSSAEIMRYSLKLLVDSGGFMENTTTLYSVVITVIIVLAGMICFTGGIIAYMSNAVTNLVDNANKGTNRIKLANHIIVINWNSKVPLLVADYLRQNEQQYIVILSDKEKDEVLIEINKKIHDLKKEEREALNRGGKVPKVIVRKTSDISSKDFDDVCMVDAASVLIVSPEEKYSIEGCDSFVIKQYMLLISYLSEFLKDDEFNHLGNVLGITVEIQKDKNIKCINDYPVPLDDGDESITPVGVNCNEILGKIMALSVVKPYLHDAIKELLSFRGSEIYARVPVYEDCDLEELNEHKIPFDEHLVICDFSIPLFDMGEQYRAFLIKDSKDYKWDMATVSNSTLGYFSDTSNDDVNEWIMKKEPIAQFKQIEENFTNNVLIVGYNERLKYTLKELIKLNKSGLKITLACTDEDQKRSISDLLKSDFDSLLVPIIDLPIHLADTEIKKIICSYSDVLVLSAPDDVFMEDRIPIAIWNIIQRLGVEDTKVYVEVLNPVNKDIVKNAAIDGNYFISNQYISGMFTQLGSDSNLYNGIMELLTLESNQNIWSYKAADILPKNSLEFETKKEFIMWMYRYSAKRIIPIGIIRNGMTFLLSNGPVLNDAYLYDADDFMEDSDSKYTSFVLQEDDEIIVVERFGQYEEDSDK